MSLMRLTCFKLNFWILRIFLRQVMILIFLQKTMSKNYFFCKFIYIGYGNWLNYICKEFWSKQATFELSSNWKGALYSVVTYVNAWFYLAQQRIPCFYMTTCIHTQRLTVKLKCYYGSWDTLCYISV